MIKKTKIVATIGLASEDKNVLRKLFAAGMNVARLNFSHGTHEWHRNVIERIKEISQEEGRPVAILADLQGPRIRTVVMEDVSLLSGEKVLVSDIFYAEKTKIVGQQKRFLLDVAKIVDDIEIGNEILIEDGLIKVEVKEKNEGILTCKVVDPGVIKNHKGVNIPDAKLKIDPITEKDERDLEFSIKAGVDFVALSFVSTGQDIENLRSKIKKILGRENNLPQIIAKIERKEAIKNLDEIIEHTDAVMVARGDLGIEIEGTRVAILQKEIIKKSLKKMKPVIVATQMLNSMIENPRPTRAEVSDVTNAVVDHADAVMLSGESASGKYPIESVQTMAQIIRDTERSPFDDVRSTMETSLNGDRVDLIRSAYELATGSGAKAIVMGSASGLTARMMSHFRPTNKMFAVTDNELTYRQLALAWGIESYLYEKGGVFREDIDWLIAKLEKANSLKKGDSVVVIMGKVPNGEDMRLIGIKQVA